MVEHPTGISILIIGRLWNDGSTMVKALGYEIDGLGRTIGHHDSLWRNTFLLSYQFLQFARPGGRIVVDQVKMLSQMFLQRRMVGMLKDVAAEVHLYQIIIAVNIVTMSLNHTLSFSHFPRYFDMSLCRLLNPKG